MKDFKFSPQFKKACQEDAKKHCMDSKSKWELNPSHNFWHGKVVINNINK